MSNCIYTTVILALALFQNFTISARAQSDAGWDFSGKNQPHAIELAKFDAQYFELSCADRIDVMVENYARMHPQFRQFLDDAKMRKKWRHALIAGTRPNRDSFNSCIYYVLMLKWHQALSARKKSLLFCGKIADGLNEFDHKAAQALEEMTGYAMLGRSLPITTLFRAINKNTRVRLNSDITYYLQLHLRKYLSETPLIPDRLATTYRLLLKPDGQDGITPERKRVMDEAFAKGEHLRIFATTAPCQGA